MRLRVLLVILAVLVAVLAVRPVFLRSDQRPIGLPVDVLVVGGSPAGVAASLAAARQGMIVVLVEPRPFLGTVMTGAMLNMVDLSRRSDTGGHLIKGIFFEAYSRFGGITFDPRKVRDVFRTMVDAEPGITLMLKTELVRPLVEDGRVIGAVVRAHEGEETTIHAVITVDATDDGDLAAAAGVPFLYGREGSGIDRRAMPATLLFRVEGVDWREIVRYAYAHRREKQPSGAYSGYAWGFTLAMRDYKAEDPRLSAHDLNIGKMADGTVWIHSLQIRDVDGTSRASRIDAYERAKREIPHLVEYLRANAPGFERAKLVEVAPELYIRETRHLQGLYTLTARDIVTSTRFWDRIGAASYPVDLHQYTKGERYPYRPVRREYTIPLRSLITAKVDGLFVASRAFSATYQAAGSARVIPTTMAIGEGVGAAAAVAIQRKVTPHRLAERRDLLREIQQRLIRAGAVIDF